MLISRIQEWGDFVQHVLQVVMDMKHKTNAHKNALGEKKTYEFASFQMKSLSG